MAAIRYIEVEAARWRSALGELLVALWSLGALGFAWLILALCLIGATPRAHAAPTADPSPHATQAPAPAPAGVRSC